MTKMKSGMAAKFPKTSGKLNYFCSHTLFLEAAVSQQGDLLLRQQFGLSHNITKLRRNYPALIGLTRPPLQNRNNQRFPNCFPRSLLGKALLPDAQQSGLCHRTLSSHQMLSIRILIGIIDMLSLAQHWKMPQYPQIRPFLMTHSGGTIPSLPSAWLLVIIPGPCRCLVPLRARLSGLGGG